MPTFSSLTSPSAPPKDLDPTVVEKAKPVDPKPFIFLDVSILREYLAVELNVPQVPFPFDLELAIDDWIFMIFFVGNDFLPHLPSLEIREGAIDVLMKIWRNELPRMGGYLTNNGKVHLDRAQIILEGLAKNEGNIFQQRKFDEDRQDERDKRRRVEEHHRQDMATSSSNGGSTPSRVGMQLNGVDYVAVSSSPSSTARGGPLHPSLPTRPTFDLVPKDEAVKTGGKRLTADQREAQALKAGPEALVALQGRSNLEAVQNTRAHRKANMSAADKLKAELEGRPYQDDEEGDKMVEDGADATEPITVEQTEEDEKIQVDKDTAEGILETQGENEGMNEEIVEPAIKADEEEGNPDVVRLGNEPESSDAQMTGDDAQDEADDPGSRGQKRKTREEDENEDDDDDEAPPDPDADQPVSRKKLQVNANGVVEGYIDDVRLWEPGYRERYYQNKFGVELSDTDFVSQ